MNNAGFAAQHRPRLQTHFELRGAHFTTRPYSLLSIGPLLGTVRQPTEETQVEIRGVPVRVRSVQSEDVTALSEMFDGSEESIAAAIRKEEVVEFLVRLIAEHTDTPHDWNYWGKPGDWYSDLDIPEVIGFLKAFLQPYEALAIEAVANPQVKSILRRIIPNLPEDLTHEEITELIGLLASEANNAEAIPAKEALIASVVEEVETAPVEVDAYRVETEMVVSPAVPTIAPLVTRITPQFDSEELGL